MRAFTPNEILQKKYKTVNWSQPWVDAFGNPEKTGIWILCGQSTNGKTALTMKLARELALPENGNGKGFLNAFEESVKMTMQNAIREHDLAAVNGRLLIRKETIVEMIDRANKPKSPWFYIIDSAQAARIKRREYEMLMELSERKLLIFTSRAEGKGPKGEIAKDIWYDADLKVWVEGYKAISNGRINPGGEYIIWKEEANKYWGLVNQINND